MAVTIVPKSSAIIPGTRPLGLKPEWKTHKETNDDYVVYNFEAKEGLTATGKVTLTADDASELVGYTLGWIQVQLMETRWAIYRGLNPSDGSFYVNYGWKPEFPLCRDVEKDPKGILYDAEYENDAKLQNRFTVPKGVGKKIELNCEFRDFPAHQWPLFGEHQDTGKKNYIAESGVEYYFCLVLSLLKPDKKTFEHLNHVYWNIGWHTRFTYARGTLSSIDPVAGFSHPGRLCKVLEGAPTDVRIKDKLTATGVSACNHRARTSDPSVEYKANSTHVFSTTGATRSKDKSIEKYDCFK